MTNLFFQLMVIALVAVFLLAPVLITAWRVHNTGLAWNVLTLAADKIAPSPGSKAYFALDGDTVEGETVSEADMPAGTTLTSWKELGVIAEATVQPESEGGEDIYDFDTTLGKHVKIATVGETVRIVYNITIQKLTTFIHMMSRNAPSYNTSTGVYSANGQAGAHYKGYLKLTQYQGTSVVTTDQFRAELSLANAIQIHSRTGVKPQLRAVLIDNDNNAFALGVAS